MAVPSTITDLNVTAASNSPGGSEAIGTSLDEYLRGIQSIVRREQAQGAAIPSASTVNIGSTTDGNYIHITGTTTITSFGTVAAGVSRTLVFDGALTLTHNATSLILPGATNITTAAGDVGEFVSEGSGNWRCVRYSRASSLATASGLTMNTGTILGRTTASAGAVEEITPGSGLTLASGTLKGAPTTDVSVNVGYTTGSGGLVTQATSKGTAVTINKPTGAITTASDALAAGATVAFNVSNSLVGANDVVALSKRSGVGSDSAYQMWAVVAAGVFAIYIKNISAGSLSEAIQISFVVLKGATA